MEYNRVRVRGLQGRTDLNGRFGTIIGPFDIVKQRWPLRMDPLEQSGQAAAVEDILVRAENLEAEAIPETLEALQHKGNHSWLEKLQPDPRQAQFVPNRTSREVHAASRWLEALLLLAVRNTELFAGVFRAFRRSISDTPAPALPCHSQAPPPPPNHPPSSPRLLIPCNSAEMAAELALDDAAVKSHAFLKFFSGNNAALPGSFFSESSPMRRLLTHMCLQACDAGQHPTP
jgi:hypothetical protein